MNNILRLLIILIAIATLCSCSTTAKVWKPYSKITITATSSINPDSSNRSSPIQIKIYELSSRSTFDNLDFDRAFHEAKTLLSDELLSDVEYTIQPSETIQHTVNLQKSSRFIAILGGFIDVDNSRWKHVYKVKPYGYYSHQISINGKALIAGKIEQKIGPSDQDKEKDASPLTADDIENGIEKGANSLEKANGAKQSIDGLFSK